ncbi:MAG: glycosyltransferase family 4 protein [Desulfobulbaceae bacterium]|nr:glycosyltransferase family 4 protein [Desulfobulbaceae bacterium]
MGHQVTVLTSIPTSATGEQRTFFDNFIYRRQVNDINVIGVSTIPIHRWNAPALIRGIGQLLNGFAYFLTGLSLKNVDVSIAYSPPLTLGLTGYLLNLFKGIPHVFNVQDLVPQYAIDLGILKNKHLIRTIKVIEHYIYRRVQCITVHSQGNKDYIVGEGVPPEKIHVVQNWVDPNLIKPADKNNEFRKKNGLDGKFIVLFAGVLGFAQDLDTVIESGVHLKDYPDIMLLIVGEGVEKERLEAKVKSMGIKNVVFHPFVSKEKYPEVVAASDVCLAPLQKRLKCPVIPSKILGYMSAGRPVITSLPLEGDAPYVIRTAECGLCVEPGEPLKLAEAIIRTFKEPAQRELWGGNGRQYILRNHERVNCIKIYEKIFNKLIA